jgi:pimeloyl-ACP methyl ester carboxylesterase
MSDSSWISRRRVLKAATMMSLGADVTVAEARTPKKQATFVLVHGAWHGGWCYARVAEILRAQGHRVFTPTLTGLGERSHLVSFGVINCSTHIQDIVNVIQWEQLKEVILCGHSYGGMVIGGVADAISERIASLVYLDAVIPEDGKSLIDGSEPQQIVEFLKTAADHGGHLVAPMPAEHFNVNPNDRAMVDALCTPQPLATGIERLKLTRAYMNIAKKTFVLATNWKGSLTREYARIKGDKSWTVIEVPYGHDVMLDAPERLAEILLNAT